MTEHVQVVPESECTDAERAAVAEVFEAVGITAEVEGADIRESAGETLPWLIQIETAFSNLGALIVAGALGAAGADGWERVNDLASRLYEARKDSSGDVTLKDPDTTAEIPLPRDLPDEAYRRLSEIERPRAPQSGILRWDRERREWIDPLAGLLRCRYQGCGEPAAEGLSTS
jgi:hypothetical protein